MGLRDVQMYLHNDAPTILPHQQCCTRCGAQAALRVLKNTMPSSQQQSTTKTPLLLDAMLGALSRLAQSLSLPEGCKGCKQQGVAQQTTDTPDKHGVTLMQPVGCTRAASINLASDTSTQTSSSACAAQQCTPQILTNTLQKLTHQHVHTNNPAPGAQPAACALLRV